MNKGVVLHGYVTSDYPVQDIDNDKFVDMFIEWIEEHHWQFCGSFGEYKYDSQENINENS